MNRKEKKLLRDIKEALENDGFVKWQCLIIRINRALETRDEKIKKRNEYYE